MALVQEAHLTEAAGPALAATELRTRLGDDGVPTHVENIAGALSIQISRTAAAWTEGTFLLREHDRTLIGVNARMAPARQRWLIAHSLGHWALHPEPSLIVDQVVRTGEPVVDEVREAEANLFAGELLMPAGVLRAALREVAGSGCSSRRDLLTRLGDLFGVGAQLVGWRLADLGLLIP